MERISVFNRNILKEIVQKYPEKWKKIRSNRKEKWISGEDNPTYKQLVKISEIFNIPFGYLFLDKLIEKKLSIPYFGDDKDLDDIIEVVGNVQKQQNYIKNILIGWNVDFIEFAGKYSIFDEEDLIIDKLKSFFDFKEFYKRKWNDIFEFFLKKIEEFCIFVVIKKNVNSKKRQKIEVEKCRGFVLYDNIAPFIFINGNDFILAQIFTFIYALVHILIGKSAVFSLKNLTCVENDEEKFCYNCTVKFLDSISSFFDKNEFKQLIENLKLLKNNSITVEDFCKYYNLFKQKKNSKIFKYKDYINDKFFEIVNIAFENKEILFRDLRYIFF